MCKLIVLDDDVIQVLVVKKVFKGLMAPDDTLYSADRNKIFNFLEDHQSDESSLPKALLVDLQLANRGGWHFLDKLQALNANLVTPLNVYVSSSQISPRDVERSGTYPFVKSFFIKPIPFDELRTIIQGLTNHTE